MSELTNAEKDYIVKRFRTGEKNRLLYLDFDLNTDDEFEKSLRKKVEQVFKDVGAGLNRMFKFDHAFLIGALPIEMSSVEFDSGESDKPVVQTVAYCFDWFNVKEDQLVGETNEFGNINGKNHLVKTTRYFEVNENVGICFIRELGRPDYFVFVGGEKLKSVKNNKGGNMIDIIRQDGHTFFTNLFNNGESQFADYVMFNRENFKITDDTSSRYIGTLTVHKAKPQNNRKLTAEEISDFFAELRKKIRELSGGQPVLLSQPEIIYYDNSNRTLPQFIHELSCEVYGMDKQTLEYNEEDPVVIFKVADFSTEMVGRYSKRFATCYIYRGDGKILQTYDVDRLQMIKELDEC